MVSITLTGAWRLKGPDMSIDSALVYRLYNRPVSCELPVQYKLQVWRRLPLLITLHRAAERMLHSSAAKVER